MVIPGAGTVTIARSCKILQFSSSYFLCYVITSFMNRDLADGTLLVQYLLPGLKMD